MKKELKKNRALLGASFLFFCTYFAHAETAYQVKEGTLDFYVDAHPHLLKVHGESKSLIGILLEKGDVKKTYDGTFTTQLVQFTSHMPTRDAHTQKNVFQTEKFPEAKISFSQIELQSGIKRSFLGKIKFHGVEKEIQVEVLPEITAVEIKFKASFHILLKDFGIEPPNFAGMTVDNEVKIEVEASAKK